MLKLKLHFFGHLIRRTDSCEKEEKKNKNRCLDRLQAGGEGDARGRDGWMASLTQWTWFWTSSRRWWRIRKPDVLQSMGSQRVKHDWGTEQEQTYVTSFGLDLDREMILRNTESFFPTLHNAGSKSHKGFKAVSSMFTQSLYFLKHNHCCCCCCCC